MDEQINVKVEENKETVEEIEVERKETEINLIEETKDKKHTKESKVKKKDNGKLVEHVLKSLTHIPNMEEKLEAICKKYCEVVDENRKMHLTLKQVDKKIAMLQREREQFQNERSKAAMTRRKLETLCRELQKQNKTVKEESLAKIREQEELRKELSEKFQGGLAQITALMNQNIDKNAKMYEENLEMNRKFKSVYEQVELKEQQLLKVHQQMKLDLQIADAKLAQVKVDATAEKETLLSEKQTLLQKVNEYQTQIKELKTTEVNLRSEINMYTNKYDEFQSALTKSNKVYGEFNMEMEKMSKKILALEKETGLWKQRWENSHTALLEMAADRQVKDAEMTSLRKKLTLLQDLCKMFQSERTSLLAQLKEKSAAAISPAALNPLVEDQDIKKSEKAIGQWQDPVAKASEIAEAVPWAYKVASTEVTDNNTTTKQEPKVAKTKLDEKNADRTQNLSKDTIDVSSKDHNLSQPEKQTTEIIDNVIEIQQIDKNNEKVPNAMALTERVIQNTDELNKVVDSAQYKDVNECSNKTTESLKTEEINKEANKCISAEIQAEVKEIDDIDGIRYIRPEGSKTGQHLQLSNSSASSEPGTSGYIGKTSIQFRTEELDKVPEKNSESSKSETEEATNVMKESTEKVLSIQPDDVNEGAVANVNSNCNKVKQLQERVQSIVEAINLAEKKGMGLSRSNLSNFISGELVPHTIENKDDNSRTCEKAIKDTNVEESTDLNMAFNKTLPIDLIHANLAKIVESNTRSLDLVDIEGTKPRIGRNFELIEDNEFSEINSMITQNPNLVIENKSEFMSESVDTVDGCSKLIDNGNAHVAGNVSSIHRDDSKSETKINYELASLKEGPVKSKDECVEKKDSKPALIKNTRKRKK